MEKGSQSGQPSASDENVLIDCDCEIFETVLSQFDPYELRKLSCDRFRICKISYISGSQTWVNS
jgi:hypothetical protein